MMTLTDSNLPAKGQVLLYTAAVLPFTPEQVAWLELIRDHTATSLSMEVEDFEYAPFGQQDGLGKAYQLFDRELPKLLDELNEVLAA